MPRRIAALIIAMMLVVPCCSSWAAAKAKVRGYITGRTDAQTVQILDDVIHFGPGAEFHVDNGNTSGLSLGELAIGTLIEAEGRWTAKHQFSAEKVSCDASQFEKQIHGTAYLDREPTEAELIGGGGAATLKTDGELLTMDANTQRAWKAASPASAAVQEKAQSRLVGRQVRYEGMRQADGSITLRRLELASSAPEDAYKVPGNRTVARTRDKQTAIDILEIRKGDKVEGRMKLFAVKEVQDYVTDLGHKLLPPSADVTARALEFRFYVVEDPHINAASLPDGTILVNTGLLGSVDNEAQLAFVLSHEIAHVLQAHHWREVTETRGKRVAILIGALAGSYFIGDVGMFLGQLGMAAVVNGYSRGIENQADRIGLQNIIDKGYAPQPALKFFRTMIEHYGDRSTSALWSNHDSSMLRGSFLSVQLTRQYPNMETEKGVVDTEKFKAMKETMGPVKVM